MEEFERFINTLKERKMWGNALHYSSLSYDSKDMYQCWIASRMYQAVDLSALEKQKEVDTSDLSRIKKVWHDDLVGK